MLHKQGAQAAMAGGRVDKGGVTIVIRREEVVEGGHHGGAWKVAYADFVTAMMAFFLLMWLLNATTMKQRSGIADYFSPRSLFSESTSGSGRPFGGRTPFDNGSMVSNRGAVQMIQGNAQVIPHPDLRDTSTVAQPNMTQAGGSGQEETYGAGDARQGAARGKPAAPIRLGDAPPASTADAYAKAAAQRAADEQAAFARAASELKAAVASDPALTDLAKQLMVDETPEGLRIQIVDQSRRPMFATGSSELDDRARLLLLKVAPVLNKLTEDISITGHTDAAPYHGIGKSNWDLSSERANATLRLLVGAGVPERRVRSVSGAADHDPLVPGDPMAAVNRRIAIVVLRAVRPR
jgi:chemotaxis protein MotB